MLTDSRIPLTIAQIGWFRIHKAHIERCLESQDASSIDELKASESYRIWFAEADFYEAWKMYIEHEGNEG